MAFDQSKFLTRFVEEAREHCSRITEGLLNLERSPGDAELLNNLFRSAHTIKGSSRMMKLSGVSELAHRMEDVLDVVRGGKISLSPPVSDLLFRGVDALSAMLNQIAAGDKSGTAPESLCEGLAQVATPSTAADAVTVAAAPPPSALPIPAEQTSPAPGKSTVLPTVNARKVDYLRVNAAKLDDLISLMGEIISEHGRCRRDTAKLREIERAMARYFNAVADKLRTGDREHEALVEAGAALHLSLRQAVRAMYDSSLLQGHLIGDLQQTSLKMRMQPLSTVFDPMRRTVRDLAHEHGKEIDFLVDGGDTELDRKIIDRIGDSLLHMIRNALDHGLENTADRVAAGKPAKGTIQLSAGYDSGCVTISVSDDGRGLCIDKIRAKALAKKLFPADTLADMSRAEIIDIIFMPGFSTSPIITDLSGRGVGMDVVRKSIVDELKGTICVESRDGRGTTFFLRLPLNLAVFPLVFLAVNGKTCALPATSIVEMLAIPRHEIIAIVNKRAIRLREQIIPVENLGFLLQLPAKTAAETAVARIVIVQDGEEKLGLVVDEIIGREEMVVKPLPSHLQNLRIVSGVTIGERNSIVNVLHAPELFKKARETAEPGRSVPDVREARRQTVLVVDDSINTRELERSILEAHGYLVEVAEDGEEAFGKTREVLYDLVITDVEMPRLDGFSLTKRLRGDERYRNVPIIIVTSLEKEEDKKRGITVGANAYIVKKAFDQSNLMETVRTLIG